MSAAPASFFAPDHEPQVAGHDAASLPSSKISGRQHSMTQLLFMRSNTFRWALVVAGVLAVFVISLFGFIYWKTDDYLVARSDKMIASQINFIANLTGSRQLQAIDQHLAQDSRGVQYAGLFGGDGQRLAGNLVQFPPSLRMND